mgnify:FL=1
MTKPTELAQTVFDLGYEIKKDIETDYWRFCARNWVEDSGLFDTWEEAAQACIDQHKDTD